MSYRTILCAGATIGIFAGTAVTHAQQQQLGQRGQQAREVLQDLEGSWDVEVMVWSVQDAQRGTQTQPGQRTGQTGQNQQQIQQIQQHIQQAMADAGVDRQQAQMQAQRLAQQFAQERPEREQILQRLQQAMIQAGVDQDEARQAAQTLSQRVHSLVQQGGESRPGLTPRDDDDSRTPGMSPGQQDRPGARPEYGQPTLEARGSSSRNWTLDEHILEEEVEFEPSSEAPTDRPGGMTGQLDPAFERLRDGETLNGKGLFGFDEQSGNLYHVWADNSQGKIFFSVGEYDSQAKTVTFHTADAQEIMNGMRPGARPTPGMRPGEDRPGMRPGEDRPGQTPGTQPGSRPGMPDDDQMSLQQTPGQTPGRTPGQYQRPGMQGQGEEGPRVVLRLIDDNEHIVEYYRASSPNSNQAVRTMVVNYKKNNGNSNDNDN